MAACTCKIVINAQLITWEWDKNFLKISISHLSLPMAWEMARSEEDHLNEVELRATHHHHRQTTIRPKGQRCKMHEWEKP